MLFQKFDTNKLIPHYTLLSSSCVLYLISFLEISKSPTHVSSLPRLGKFESNQSRCLILAATKQPNFGYTVSCASRCCCSFVLISTQIPHCSFQIINNTTYTLFLNQQRPCFVFLFFELVPFFSTQSLLYLPRHQYA